jgi:hypothetical protein
VLYVISDIALNFQLNFQRNFICRSMTGETANAGTVLSLGLDQAVAQASVYSLVSWFKGIVSRDLEVCFLCHSIDLKFLPFEEPVSLRFKFCLSFRFSIFLSLRR